MYSLFCCFSSWITTKELDLSLAFLSYRYLDKDKKTIDYLHTEVPVEFRGTGLALDLAKASSIKSCAFECHYNNKNPAQTIH